jgi:putative glutamine amidotransferase
VRHIATWIRECDETHFERAFSPYPDLRLHNARTGQVPWAQVEGLLLTGGSDISQNFLRQPVPDPSLIEDADLARDTWEFDALAKTLEQRLPLLAICRGLQMLNVFQGGTLFLDIPHHDDDKYRNIQELCYVADVPIQFSHVNSSHHQAVNRLGTGLEVQARCAADQVIEQLRLVDYPFGLAVQYHPERDILYQPFFDAFAHHLQKAS